MIFTKKRNNPVFLIIVFSGLFLFSCTRKEERKKEQVQNVDSLLNQQDSVLSDKSNKINSADVRKKFSEIKSKYENEFDAVTGTDVRFNDFDGDGRDEALLYYYLTARGGNATTGSGVILYRINGSSLEFITDFNLDGAVVKSIKGNRLDCAKYEYAAGDPNCCPSKKKPFKLIFEKNKFDFIP